MKMYEYEGKQLLNRLGITTPIRESVDNPEAAAIIGENIGYPVVLKVQVQQGGRGKAGVVEFAHDSWSAKKISRRLLSFRNGRR